jgi:RNA polymerase sigma factor (sigma-70 family)
MAPKAGSVSGWINQLQAGDASAAQPLWERYFRQLVRLARERLQRAGARNRDEEDLALSAFASFCLGVQHGRFPQLRDRNDLWRLLVMLTARKIWHHRRDRQRHKRGNGLAEAPASQLELEGIVGREPSPAFAAEMADQLQQRLGKLETDELRAVALRKLEGYTTEEIAAQLGCARATVERRLRLIRLQWTEEERP